MTAEEIKKAIRETRHELKTASGYELIALIEYRDNLLFIPETK